MEAPLCRLCGERHWPAIACRFEVAPEAAEPEPVVTPQAEPEAKPKTKRKRKGRAKQNAVIRKRLQAVREIAKLGGVNIQGVHCPTCTCRSKRLHSNPATRQAAYRVRQRMLKQHQQHAPQPPESPAEPDPSCG